jgi:hypothetical protein
VIGVVLRVVVVTNVTVGAVLSMINVGVVTVFFDPALSVAVILKLTPVCDIVGVVHEQNCSLLVLIQLLIFT